MSHQLDFSKELTFRTSKSSGKGGQHINKVETRVELLFDVENSEILSKTQKSMIRRNLQNRINQEGILILSNGTERSQKRNKSIVVKRFYQIVNQALIPEKKRKFTKVPQAVQAKRIMEKKQRGEKKAFRKKVNINDFRDIDLS